MKTSLKAISLIVAFTALSTTVVSAQSLLNSNWTGVCVNLPNTLSYGSANADVMRLQVFLVAQNFPGGGTWMETGHFGAATQAAVKDFQQEVGIPMSGIADVATRAAISRATCGNAVVLPTPPVYPTPTPVTIPWNQYNNNYPYNYGTGYGNGYGLISLNLVSLSQNTGSVGTPITIYGTGFDATNNTINFGSVAITGVSSNGTSLTFVIPPYVSGGTANISVTDSRGTSNSLTFTVNQYGQYGCGNNYFANYNYSGSCGCPGYSGYNTGYNSAYPYNTYGSNGNCGTQPTGNITAPTISYITPISGGVGTSVTVIGTGFTSSNNTVHFGNGIITGLSSNDGRSVSFTVPATLTGYGTSNTGLGIYNISVTNSIGYSTTIVPFTVTSLNSNGNSAMITSVNGPTAITVGSISTWIVTVSNPNSSSLTVTPNWGDTNTYQYNNAIAPQTITAGGTATLTFTHTYSVNGTYNVSFTATNSAGSQTSPVRSVVVTNSNSNYGVPTISYITPNAGSVGTQVTIYGSNFASNSTIMFGNGAISNVASNGSTITFTIPSYVGPYCAPGNACPQYAISITPGTYNVSVMNSNGTSNTVSFTVI